jgi:hypothetical protein
MLSLCLAAGWAYRVWWVPVGTEKPFNRAAFEQVVHAVLSGSLRPDAKGIVVLPPSQASLTVTGRVYVYRGDSGKALIFFPSWLGRQRRFQDDNWVSGYLYDAGSSVVQQPGEANGWSEIHPPKYSAPWDAARNADIEPHAVPFLTTHRYSRNWFAIEAFP